MAPPSQKFRTIGFRLSGGASAPLNFTFSIRPEDLRHSEPSRTSVQQTLGGALVDSFGASLSTITMTGHNGWRGGFLSSGESLFADLRAATFTEWHKRRQAEIDAGNDPANIELTLTDTLDAITVVVAPMSFSLQRSRSSPLLMRYNLELTVLSDASLGDSIGDSILSALSNPLRWIASVTGLGNVLSSLQSAYAWVQSTYAAVQGYVGQFMSTAMNVLGLVTSLTNLASAGGLLGGLLAPYLSSGAAVIDAAANAFHALAAGSNDNISRLNLMAIASDFTDASCTLGNGFATGQVWRSLADMQGASNCSSTGGGNPASAFTLAGTSPLSSIFATTPPDLGITLAAQQALTTLGGDPLALALNPATVGASMLAVANGVTVPPIAPSPPLAETPCAPSRCASWGTQASGPCWPASTTCCRRISSMTWPM
jgi:hypothetical protein